MKKWIVCCLCLFLALQISCLKKSKLAPFVSIVVGDAKLNRNGNEQSLLEGKYLKAQDNIQLSEQSKVKLTIGDSRSVYLNKGTKLEISSVTNEKIDLVLENGELQIAQNDSQNRSISVLTPSCSITSSYADVNISFDPQKNTTSIMTLRGEVNVSSGGKLTAVPPCSKYLFSEGQINGPIQIIESDIAGLENWVGKSTIDVPVEEIGCKPSVPVTVKNLPPEWKKMAKVICEAGKSLIDTVLATDPQNKDISYSIVNGPQGMEINNQGIITCKEIKAGSYHIKLRAMDSDSLSTDTEYVLIAKNKEKVKENEIVSAEKKVIVKSPPSAVLNVSQKIVKDSSDTASVQVVVTKGLVIDSLKGPDTAHVGENISFECSIVNPEFPAVNFDWSFDGGTIFEAHSKTSVIKHQYNKEGTFTVNCKATDEKGQSATKQKQIIIVNLKSYVKACGPYKTFVNSFCSFEGKAADKYKKITNYSWDFNGDGKAEWSSGTNSKTQYKFTKAGVYKVVFSVATDDGQKTTDSTSVTVVNRPPVAKACNDIVSYPGRKVKLSGTGSDPDSGKIIYRWDFDGDGKIDWTSEKSGIVEHRFDKYTKAIFSVMDADSAIAYDTVRIIICPDEMQTIEKGKFCIDKYEYPNKKGTIPDANVTYEEASGICAKSGKRLCTEQEWQTACSGDEKGKWDYPYGNRFEEQRCNTVGNPDFNNKPMTSGYFETCTNSKGVYDMSGNVAEWTQATGKNNPYIYGGSWQNGANESKCSSKVQLQKGKKYFYAGFRCCK